jgi:hypothetical protein
MCASCASVDSPSVSCSVQCSMRTKRWQTYGDAEGGGPSEWSWQCIRRADAQAGAVWLSLLERRPPWPTYPNHSERGAATQGPPKFTRHRPGALLLNSALSHPYAASQSLPLFSYPPSSRSLETNWALSCAATKSIFVLTPAQQATCISTRQQTSCKSFSLHSPPPHSTRRRSYHPFGPFLLQLAFPSQFLLLWLPRLPALRLPS